MRVLSLLKQHRFGPDHPGNLLYLQKNRPLYLFGPPPGSAQKKKQKLVVLIFHLAFLLIIIGAGITRYISYEGIMPIKEGAVSNKFLTEKNFISIVVNDGTDEKTPVHFPILLSSIGDNNFKYETDFRGTDIVVKLTDYIPNATTVFEESETGEAYC